jgi:hypothetical protein
VYQRFKKEPKRYPLWLQYMVVHFSGMRYASAHSSWADPKDLLIRLRGSNVDKDLKKLDDAEIEKRCREKIIAYESAGAASSTNKPNWHRLQKRMKDKVAAHVERESERPQTRRAADRLQTAN